MSLVLSKDDIDLLKLAVSQCKQATMRVRVDVLLEIAPELCPAPSKTIYEAAGASEKCRIATMVALTQLAPAIEKFAPMSAEDAKVAIDKASTEAKAKAEADRVALAKAAEEEAAAAKKALDDRKAADAAAQADAAEKAKASTASKLAKSKG